MAGLLENRFSDEEDDDDRDGFGNFPEKTEKPSGSGRRKKKKTDTEKPEGKKTEKRIPNAENGNDVISSRLKNGGTERKISGDYGYGAPLEDETADDFAFEIRSKDNAPAMSEEDEQELKDLEDLMSEDERIREEKHHLRMTRAGQIALAVLCVYMIVLIFGAVITEYHYDENGLVQPVVLSVSEIEEKNEYETLVSLYLQARELYERILVLDYRVALNEEDLMTIAPEYEDALDTVSILATNIEAADLLSKYGQVNSMLLEWVQTHIAAYCQYMSAAITQNDSSAAEEAIASRNYVYSNFQLITENMVSLGEEIPSYDLTDISSWSPEGYVAEAVEGITNG